MALFKKGAYRASTLVRGTRHQLRMIHPTQSAIGQFEAICLDYNGSGFHAHAKAGTKGEADRLLAEKLGVRAPSVPTAPKLAVSAPFVPNSITHQPASEFRGVQYGPRSYVSGPELHKVCQFLAKCVRDGAIPSGDIRWIPAKGKKCAKWEIGAELLPEFWPLVHGDMKGVQIRVLDRTRKDTEALVITV